jgi:hypothetical protein
VRTGESDPKPTIAHPDSRPESCRSGHLRRTYRTEINARPLQQALPLSEVEYLSPGKADATRPTNEGQVARPWSLWHEQARRRIAD